MSKRDTWRWNRSTERRMRAAPTIAAANELRNLLPGLVVKVTKTKPCADCAAPIKAKGPRFCPRCKPIHESGKNRTDYVKKYERER